MISTGTRLDLVTVVHVPGERKTTMVHYVEVRFIYSHSSLKIDPPIQFRTLGIHRTVTL